MQIKGKPNSIIMKHIKYRLVFIIVLVSEGALKYLGRAKTTLKFGGHFCIDWFFFFLTGRLFHGNLAS